MPWWWPLRRVAAIEPSELSERLALGESIQLIDVRTKAEYDSGHIPGATHIPIQSLPQRMGRLDLDPARPVITICKTAHRSIPATRLLAERGYNAAQLAHGMDRWRREGFPTTTTQ